MMHGARLALFLLLAGCVGSSRPGSTTADDANATTGYTPVLLVSIDGFRPDYLERGQTPVLTKLAAGGVRAEWMLPSFPTLTFPNHYTIVTGLYPDHHGIVHNSMYDKELGRFTIGRSEAVQDGRWWAEGEPIWVTADKQGLVTATMFWPGSEAEIHGYRPDHWRPYDGEVTASQRVDQILAWLELPGAERPDFLTLYFDAVDHAGHHAGPDSEELDGALAHVDKAMGRLVAGLKQRGLFDAVNLIIVSDHGMASSPPDQVIRMDEVIDLDDVHVTSMGVLAGFTPKKGHAEEVAKALLKQHTHMICRRKDNVPGRLHYGSNPRIPPFLCLARPGWQISATEYLAKRKYPLPRGQHGYDNLQRDMRAIFIAHGPAFPQGETVPGFPNVDVYPLLVRLLGIEPEPNDGNPATAQRVLANQHD